MSSLRMLAQRRLTEAQLWTRLERRGHEPDAVAAAVARCKTDGYLDDRLFAELFVEGTSKALGDVRLVGTLVRKGIDRETARRTVAEASRDERARITAAIDALRRRTPELAYPSAARKLERLGFPASLIYATLRAQLEAAAGS